MGNNFLVVLDRDGVINIDHGYVHTKDEFQFIDGIFELCRVAVSRGCEIAIATNQAGIARGLYSEDDFWALTKWMSEEFNSQGVQISHVLYCPHHPDFPTGNEEVCDCRKPLPGLLNQALALTKLSQDNAVMIGNSETDVLAGRAAAFKYCVKIGEPSEKSDFSFNTVKDLADWSKSEWFWPFSHA